MNRGYTSDSVTDVFVSPAWVGNNHQDVTVVDVRREWEYEEGHLPEAVNVPFEAFRDPTDETPGKLPTAREFASLLGEAGIGADDRVVAYDDEFGVYASRLLVTALVFGHDPDRLHLLDGDLQRWGREREFSTAEPDAGTREYLPEAGSFDPLLPEPELERALDTSAVIVDTRNSLEYATVHVAGAINLQWRDFVDEQRRRLRPREKLWDVLEAHGITQDRPVKLYCNTARRLSFVYAVLQELGHDDVAIYEGGIDAWADYGGPVETGR